MRKIFALVAAAALTLSLAAPVFAEGNDIDACTNDDSAVKADWPECTVPAFDPVGGGVQIQTLVPAGKVALCQYPGADDAMITGAGYGCIEGGGHIIFVSEKAAAARGLL